MYASYIGKTAVKYTTVFLEELNYPRTPLLACVKRRPRPCTHHAVAGSCWSAGAGDVVCALELSDSSGSERAVVAGGRRSREVAFSDEECLEDGDLGALHTLVEGGSESTGSGWGLGGGAKCLVDEGTRLGADHAVAGGGFRAGASDTAVALVAGHGGTSLRTIEAGGGGGEVSL